MRRDDVSFAADGVDCAGWLYRPEGEGPHPVVVLAHGFAGTRRDRIYAYAERFAGEGMAALVFDYRGFGESGGEPRQVLDIRGQQDDYRAAVAWVREQPGLDAGRVALWGTSFSGGHVVEVAASDPAIAAVVAQTPFADGIAQLRAADPVASLRITAVALRDEVAARTGRAPVYLPVYGDPGEVAALTSADSKPGFFATLHGEGSQWRDEVAARVMLRIGSYRPVRRAAQVRCPLLVCVADDDDLTPVEPAIRIAEMAPRGELRRYCCGHYSIYTGDGFEQAAGDQAAFLRRHLGLDG